MTLETAWDRAVFARACFLIAPDRLGGLWLRARSGPVRDRFLAPILSAYTTDLRRIHPAIDDQTLYGGIDLTTSLTTGGLARSAGILQQATTLLLSMAERAPAGLVARLGAALDQRPDLKLLALDEGAEEAEALSPTLSDRLALQVDLTEVGLSLAQTGSEMSDIPAARARLSHVVADAACGKLLVELAASLGIESLRAPIQALHVARISAALNGSPSVTEEDLANAAALVLLPRATQMPAPADDSAEPEPEQTPPENQEGQGDNGRQPELSDALPEELLLEAVRALLPNDLLDRLAARSAVRAAESGAGDGAKRRGNRRGRPLPARPGKPRSGHRVDLIATLRAAAPWQKVRQGSSMHNRLKIRASDIHLKAFEERSDRAVIFCVDASGSAALARLAEAKGAVELLLAQAYARRDYVALLAFRGQQSDLLLPPTRSLVQTKRRLAALPGGGGTPLAAGLQDALSLSDSVRSRGMTPAIAVLTDGRANIALDGTANRAQAASDARDFARLIRARHVPAMVIDTGQRPSEALGGLARDMGAGYLPLPRADAKALSNAVESTLCSA
ncbi:MAG: magnesium chelatase subunit D [Pseudomonadota bacterium]